MVDPKRLLRRHDKIHKIHKTTMAQKMLHNDRLFIS